MLNWEVSRVIIGSAQPQCCIYLNSMVWCQQSLCNLSLSNHAWSPNESLVPIKQHSVVPMLISQCCVTRRLFVLVDNLCLNHSSDVNKIHAGIGDTLAILIQWITTFIAGFVVGFIVEWRLTLLLLPVAPFLAASGAIFSVVSHERSAHSTGIRRW